MNISKKGVQAAAISGLFFLLGIVEVYVVFSESIQLMHSMQHHASRIDFHKGDYYLFGGGLILSLFPLSILLALIFKPGKEASEKLFRVMLMFLGLCLISMPVLPQVVSISVGNYLENRGYVYCDSLSSQWLFVRTMVYQKGSCKPIPK